MAARAVRTAGESRTSVSEAHHAALPRRAQRAFTPAAESATSGWNGCWLPALPAAIPVHPGAGIALADDPVQQTGTQPQTGQAIASQGDGQNGGTGGGQAEPQPMEGGTRIGKVTAVTLLDSSTGALTGFPALTNVPDLNKPGPFNDTTTGACQNVQQIRFDLSGIPPAEVDLFRKKDGVAGPVGQEQSRTGPDGPSDLTKLRKDSLIAVADTPGIARATAGFPLHYAMNFQLYAFDIVSKAILAKATYSVNILKQSVSDAKPVNELKNFQATRF